MSLPAHRSAVERRAGSLEPGSAQAGIFKALNILHSQQPADEWVRLPNTNRIFRGTTPLQRQPDAQDRDRVPPQMAGRSASESEARAEAAASLLQ